MVPTSDGRYAITHISCERLQYTRTYKYVAHIIDTKTEDVYFAVGEISDNTLEAISPLGEDYLVGKLSDLMYKDLQKHYGDVFNAKH